MVSLTRRRALQGAVALLAGLAGCNLDGDGIDAPSDSPTEPGRGLSQIERDPECLMLRASEYEPDDSIAWFVADADDRATGSGTVQQRDRDSRGFIASEETAATLSVGDVDSVTSSWRREEGRTPNESVDGAAEARKFVAETDFDRETIYLEQHPVRECYRHVLCYVTWDDSELETRYGQFLRGHDVACAADAKDALATFVRIPAALDPSVVERGGTGVSNGYCFAPPDERGRPTPRDDFTATMRTGPATDEQRTTGRATSRHATSESATDGG